jgi:4-amino-4-deoxy-L-arabinose transferase-like glycosyltransferase
MRTVTIGAHERPVSARATASPFTWVSAPTFALASIVLLAAALRVASLRAVPDNLFYDAAVRSMSQSWHNFFYAAFEPGGKVAIDKPPIDLWLQVVSVKLLGFNSVALKLPEAVAGTATVALAYGLVRRLFGTGAGVVTALALAVLPITVLTSRSDTMDTLMVMLILVAAWLVVRAAETGRVCFLYLAAAVIGLDFDVKLFEALLPVPALVALYLLAARESARKRLGQIAAAALVFVAVALSWPTAVSFTSAAGRPYPLGSSDGSVWSSIFVFDGLDRAGSPSVGHDTARGVPPPAADRLFASGPAALDKQVGSELVPAIALGILAIALVLTLRKADSSPSRVDALRRRVPECGGAVALGVWLATGTVGFSLMARLHPRYLESFSPAIAATLGVGLVTVAKGSIERRWTRLALLPVFGLCVAYAVHVATRQPGLQTFILCTATLAALCLVASTLEPPLRTGDAWEKRMMGFTTIVLLLPLLAVPASESLAIVRHHTSDSTTLLARSPQRLAHLSRYLVAHQGHARYEVATRNPWQAAPLIVQDGRPVLIVRNVNGRALVPIPTLRKRIRAGQVKYVWLGRRCSRGAATRFKGCQPLARWVTRHGRKVTELPGQGLWRVPARAA